MKELLEDVIGIARRAGAGILEVYELDDFGVETKADNSPLTKADLAAHKIIVSGLQALNPSVPILSEESDDIPYVERREWQRYFLIDPLDGTKEFINRNGEFTVNIALIDKGIPVLGVVYVPVKDVIYAGQQLEGRTAFVERAGSRSGIVTRNLAAHLDSDEALTVVASRRHGGAALEKCLAVLQKRFPRVESTNMGSSLKLCLVAEGKADLYPRLAPTSEWDTAAAQAIVEAAGGTVVDTNLKPLQYNGKENILNPFFYVIGDRSFAWNDVLKDVLKEVEVSE
ncbi:MAG: 3'(2'),5'-bisphosphate nucleotidase [Gammaproteobacteria bacterium]|jgi:3'(2'), 5'-bisphosphate nucleotidase|nr:3'(2'),5'-bisphosphate nucleotidase [Gammaproteobacteria bacterium]|tara:strand:- start:4085 stop:4936 length:852 start_codon:yes stop_codon:yes gene_type:complete